MYYAVYCTDSAEGSRLRQEHMDPHRAHVASVADKLRLAGPCPAAEGQTREASLLVIEADSAAEVRAIMEADPYFKAGVWENVVVRPFRALSGSWLPKKA